MAERERYDDARRTRRDDRVHDEIAPDRNHPAGAVDRHGQPEPEGRERHHNCELCLVAEDALPPGRGLRALFPSREGTFSAFGRGTLV